MHPDTGGRGVAPQMDDILGDLVGSGPSVAPAPSAAAASAGGDLLGDLLGLDNPAPASAPPSGDLFGFGIMGGASATPAPSLPEILDVSRGKGLRICGKVVREGGHPVYKLSFSNSTPGTVSGLMIQFNKNSFGLVPASQEINVRCP